MVRRLQRNSSSATVHRIHNRLMLSTSSIWIRFTHSDGFVSIHGRSLVNLLSGISGFFQSHYIYSIEAPLTLQLRAQTTPKGGHEFYGLLRTCSSVNRFESRSEFGIVFQIFCFLFFFPVPIRSCAFHLGQGFFFFPTAQDLRVPCRILL